MAVKLCIYKIAQRLVRYLMEPAPPVHSPIVINNWVGVGKKNLTSAFPPKFVYPLTEIILHRDLAEKYKHVNNYLTFQKTSVDLEERRLLCPARRPVEQPLRGSQRPGKEKRYEIHRLSDNRIETFKYGRLMICLQLTTEKTETQHCGGTHTIRRCRRRSSH